MAGRVRLYGDCKCGCKEISVKSIVDANGYTDLSTRQCTTCWDVVSFHAIGEPDWPMLLRGL